MYYDIAYTRFAKIVTLLYDAGHYILFDLSYWWWALATVVIIIDYFITLNLFVYETHTTGRLGGGASYYVKYAKKHVNPLVAGIVGFVGVMFKWMFIVLSAAYCIRLIISGYEWLFSPIIV